MTVLVSVETLLLALLALLVTGLLRSHAEILRRLDHGHHSDAGAQFQPTGANSKLEERVGVVEAEDIRGQTLSGEPVTMSVRTPGTNTLIAFLTTGCELCGGFWEAFRTSQLDAPGVDRVVVVTKDRHEESTSKLRRLAPGHIQVILSSAAWQTYGVPVYPYFVYVHGASGTVRGGGAAETWSQVVSLLGDALADEALEREEARGPYQMTPSWREESVDEILRQAGIGPDHPSLYDRRWSVDQLEDS